MAKRRKGLTFEEHDALAAELFAMRNHLIDVIVQLGGAYPKANPVNRYVDRAEHNLDMLRCVLEDHLFHEHPERAETHVYYRAGRHG